jgi:hypothetical protein
VTHLSSDQLSAFLDQRLEPRAMERAEHHLNECSSCRDALAGLEAQDQMLARSLDHDPGEAYFESFADRVGERLRAESLAGAQKRHGGQLAAIFRSPRRVAMLATVAAVVVGAGVVLMSVKETEFAQLRAGKGVQMAQRAPTDQAAPSSGEVSTPAENEAEMRAKDTGPATEVPMSPGVDQKGFAAPPRDLAGAKRQVDKDAGSVYPPPAATLEKKAAPAPSANQVAPNRLREVRRDANGEEVMVPNAELDRLRYQAKPAPTPAPAGGPVHVTKQLRAEPMRETQQAPQLQFQAEEAKLKTQKIPTQGQALAMKDEAAAAASRICGDVRDPLGRGVAGAQVILRETGIGAPTDAQGHFCLDAPAGTKTLAVMAVGYQPADLTVQLGANEQYASIQLAPVSTTGTLGNITRGFADSRGGAVAPGGALNVRGARPGETAFNVTETLSRAARGAMDNARKLSAASTRANTAAAAQAAAGEWERAASLLPDGAAQRDARFEAARERYGVWQRAHSAEAADFAATAVRRCLEVEPAGARRTLVEGWLKALGR